VQKLLREMSALSGDDRKARFVCVTTLAQNGRAVAVLSDSAQGVIAKAPQGSGGFGYDPVFFFPQLGRTYAEITREEKNQYSHRGRAFRKALAFLEGRVP
jgi:XTP/dITP diphosphohydrolase